MGDLGSGTETAGGCRLMPPCALRGQQRRAEESLAKLLMASHSSMASPIACSQNNSAQCVFFGGPNHRAYLLTIGRFALDPNKVKADIL